MATFGRPAEDVGLNVLMAESPEPRAHMSVAGEGAFLFGLASLLTAPFSTLLVVSVVLAAVSFAFGMVGMVTTRQPGLAGSALSAVGMFAGLLAAALIGLRYAGLDTAFGDDISPWLVDQLERWNSRLPQPG